MKKESSLSAGRKMGRPLSFDRDTALQKAMLAFWRHGYETTSINDLTSAMGVTAPSIYTAFGDKKRLFLEAVHLYAGSEERRVQAIAEAESAYAAASDILSSAARLFTGDDTPPGCLLASSTASGSEASADVREAVAQIRSAGRRALRLRIEQDVKRRLMPNDTDAAALSDLVFATVQGMSVLARDGATRVELERLTRQALTMWPSTALKPRAVSLPPKPKNRKS